jgi:ATP-dependent Clp protease ATP-binding subunit ClpC
MFERYTEKARRVIFFARYEASRYGSPYIEGEHVLLGLIREHKGLQSWIPGAYLETIQKRIDEQTFHGPPISTSVDLPLSASCKTILKVAGEEAERLSHRNIGTEHLFLAMFSVEGIAAKLLAQAGADPAAIRAKLAEQTERQLESLHREARLRGDVRAHDPPIEIHGIRWKTSDIRDSSK